MTSRGGRDLPQPAGAIAETPSAGWNRFYKLGGAAAIAIVVLYVIETIGVGAMGPPPATVDDWFTLFRNHGLLGLFDAYLLDVVAVALMVPLFLALYAALGRADRAYVTLATALAFVGIAVFLTTNITFSMFYLSSQMRLRRQMRRGLCSWQQGKRWFLFL
jgi:hypothetical protein